MWELRQRALAVRCNHVEMINTLGELISLSGMNTVKWNPLQWPLDQEDQEWLQISQWDDLFTGSRVERVSSKAMRERPGTTGGV